MGLQSTGEIRMSQINAELGRTSSLLISLDEAENGTYGAINTGSPAYPSATNPASMSEWYSYVHAGDNFSTNIGSGFNNSTYGIAVQSDGKILVCGVFTSFDGTTLNRIARLNSDGTEDTAFTTNIGSGFNGETNTVVIQSDGKILVGGNYTIFNGVLRRGLVRLNSNGTEDTSFGGNLGGGFSSSVQGVAVQSDGKILVCGFFSTFKSNTRNRLVRLNSNGTEDTSFYSNLGSGFLSAAWAVVVQSNGKILVGGNYTQFNGNSRGSIIRLNSNGTEDTTFATNIGTGFNGAVLGLAVKSNGTIVVGGTFTPSDGTARSRIATLSSSGVDNTSSMLQTGFNERIYFIAVQSDGKILAGGNFTSFNGNTRNRLVRINDNLTSEDTSFYTNLGSGFSGNTVRSIAVQSGGKILVVGAYSNLDGVTKSKIVRLSSDGVDL